MQRWEYFNLIKYRFTWRKEYKVQYFGIEGQKEWGQEGDNIEQYFYQQVVQLGLDGWELTSVLPYYFRGEQNVGSEFWFKRLIED